VATEADDNFWHQSGGNLRDCAGTGFGDPQLYCVEM
jgi:hypothetical protein